jgi:predicted metal-dependent HD superfamily phosphohydrolase
VPAPPASLPDSAPPRADVVRPLQEGARAMSDPLRSAWLDLLASLGVGPETAGPGFDELAAAYSAPDRAYHNLDHVAAVLAVVDELADLTDDPAAVRLAAWYHDVVYDPRASDNEERSATLAEARLRGWGVAATTAAEVARLIRLTRTHQADADDADGHVLLDADLAVLASPPDEYDRYARAIRREYAWVADDAFRAGRAEVLRSFARRPQLYFTARMRERGEEAARANLARELAALEAGDVREMGGR